MFGTFMQSLEKSILENCMKIQVRHIVCENTLIALTNALEIYADAR